MGEPATSSNTDSGSGPLRARGALESLRRFTLHDYGTQGAMAYGMFKSAELALRALSDYHAHRVVGLEHVPRTGPALFALNHSFATYDSWLFGVAVRESTDRMLHAIGDRLLLRLPVIGPTFRELGFTEGSREGAVETLSRGELLGLVPGGMRESLRSSRDKYRIDWKGRLGFVWASCLSGAPVILAACPRADDIYDVADLGITRIVYERFKMPFALFRGVGPTLVPRPVPLTHLVSEPIPPPVPPDQVTREIVEEHHALLAQRMTRLLGDALSLDARGGSR